MSAGSISKKLRGLNIKSRAWIEILLHCIGVRVYFSITQGAFGKIANADYFLGSLTSARSDLHHWCAIGRSRAVGRVGRRRASPARDSAAAGSSEMPNPALRGSVRPGLGSEMINTVCVIHLRAQNGELEFGMACAMAGADLRGKAHRRARVRLLRGLSLGASVPVRVRGSNSSGNEARAGLCGVAVDMAAVEWWWRNAGVVFSLPEWHTRHYSTRKRKRGILKCSPRPEIE
jgi:hypothetical protein